MEFGNVNQADFALCTYILLCDRLNNYAFMGGGGACRVSSISGDGLQKRITSQSISEPVFAATCINEMCFGFVLRAFYRVNVTVVHCEQHGSALFMLVYTLEGYFN
jgi:hypothetical protein